MTLQSYFTLRHGGQAFEAPLSPLPTHQIVIRFRLSLGWTRQFPSVLGRDSASSYVQAIFPAVEVVSTFILKGEWESAFCTIIST